MLKLSLSNLWSARMDSNNDVPFVLSSALALPV